jgi:uncharacterized delta-60 repeat protein
MKIYFLLLVLCFSFLTTQAQEFRLDTSFGEQGIVTTQTNHTSEIYDVAHSPDGRIIAVGANVVTQFQMCAYLPNGELDRTFGEEGILYSNEFSEGSASCLQIQPDLKILASHHKMLIRYLPNGEYDKSFGNNGRVQVPDGSTSGNSFSSVVLLSDGKIIVAGDLDSHFFLLGLQSDGSIDSAFGNDGKVSTAFPYQSYILSAISQTDGKIVVAGATGDYPKTDFAIARYTRKGKIDSTFGNNGTITTEFHPSPFAEAGGSTIKLLPNGKLLVVGSSGFRLAMARYHPDGSLDSSFAQNGKFLSDSLKHGNDVIILPNNKFVVSANVETSPFNYAFSMLRFNENGSLDSAFGNAGELILDISTGNDYIHSLELISDGEIIVAGSSRDTSSTPSKFALAKFVFDGANSVSDRESQKPWAIYPNPSSTYFIAHTDKSISETHQLELVNITGQTVLKQYITENNAKFDISSLPPGLYVYKIQSSKAIVQNGRFIKE